MALIYYYQEADIKLMKRLVESGKLFGINVWDHIILSENSYYSFADDGVM